MTLPSFDQLPIDAKYPPKTAWGVWGEDDNLGTLNLLTEERVAEASKCIKRGAVFALNWELEKPSPPLFERSALQHKVVPLAVGEMAFDDCYDNFNTQSSSQWDGLKHICHLPAKKFYNGIECEAVANSTTDRLGIHHMARKGIVGRAVLLDFARWAVRNRPDYDPCVYAEITVDDLEKVAAAQKVTFQHGDILLVRTGWIATTEERGTVIPECAGIKPCDETFRWLWDNHFSAVGSDNFPFEAFPPKSWEASCHSMLLGGWGMPIGEMFYLEKLADDSAKDGVYTYFFTSAPLNKLGGVATPPNALCIK